MVWLRRKVLVLGEKRREDRIVMSEFGDGLVEVVGVGTEEEGEAGWSVIIAVAGSRV